MQGAKDFYRIGSLIVDDGKLSCSLTFNGAHDIFKGHFPGNPIVPGVCTIGIVKEVLETALEKRLMLAKASVVKYLGLIKPDMEVQLEIIWLSNPDNFGVNAKISLGIEALFKMTAHYREA